MTISTVGIVGGGLMGSGIAEVCAREGMRTHVCEKEPEPLAASRRGFYEYPNANGRR